MRNNLYTLKLLLPVLIPSWRFFDFITPSPRIEATYLKTRNDTGTDWQELNPRPEHLPFGKMLLRLFYNPQWNETLFLTRCAERLITNDEPAHHQEEIFKHIIAKNDHDLEHFAYMQFRLIFIERHNEALKSHTLFTSPIRRIDKESPAS